jgi:hypothetical protein
LILNTINGIIIKLNKTGRGDNEMAANKYERYFIREPLADGIFSPRLLFDTKNYFPDINFGIRYTYIERPFQLETPHAHDYNQFLIFMGTPEDQRVFDGEVEVYLGKEGTKNIVNSTTVLHIPAGMIHCPIIWKRVDKPMMFVNVVLTPSYTRSDQKTAFHDYLGLSAKKVTATEAGRRLGAAVPMPAYLPKDNKIQEIYVEDNSVRILISDKEIKKSQNTIILDPTVPKRWYFDCEMDITVRWHPQGMGTGSKAIGEPVKIGKGKNGILSEKEMHVELNWLLPEKTTARQPGQYELVLATGKPTPREELLKVADSLK